MGLYIIFEQWTYVMYTQIWGNIRSLWSPPVLSSLILTHVFKADVCKTEFAANVPFKVISAIFNFYIPTTCMVVLYVRIFLAIKERSRDMEKISAKQGVSVGVSDDHDDDVMMQEVLEVLLTRLVTRFSPS